MNCSENYYIRSPFYDILFLSFAGLGALQESLKETNNDLQFLISVSDPQLALINASDIEREIDDQLKDFLQTVSFNSVIQIQL